MTTPINPEALLQAMLKGAQMAIPAEDWRIEQCYFRHAVFGNSLNIFNPLESDSDAMKLERALKQKENGGWIFWKFQYETLDLYVSDNGDGRITDPSDTLLLLKCVAAQTGIPLHSLPLQEPV